MPTVTAICPTANRPKWVPLAVECFLSQTFTDSELLIVDDGEQPTPVPDYARIRYIRLEPYVDPQGRAHRKTRPTGLKRNLCCEEARGEVILHFDDDDWYAPTRIESQLAFMEQTGKPFVGYHAITFWGTPTSSDKEPSYHYLGVQPYASGTSQCYLKSFWEQNKFDSNKWIGEDSDLSSHALQLNAIDSQDGRQMVVARAHPDSTCPPNLGSKQFPRCPISEVPIEFLKAIGVRK